VIWVGNDAVLTTQNSIFRVGKFECRGGKVKKSLTPFLHTLFKKRAGGQGMYFERPNLMFCDM